MHDIAELRNKFALFRQFVPAAYIHLAPLFWAEEETRSRIRLQIIGLCGIVLLGGLTIGLFLSPPDGDDRLVLNGINLVVLVITLLFTFNRYDPIRRLPLPLLFYTGFILLVVNTAVAAFFLEEIISFLFSLVLFNVVFLLVAGFHVGAVLSAFCGPLAYFFVRQGVDLPQDLTSSAWFMDVFNVTAPFFVLVVNYTIVNQRWRAFLTRHLLQEANEQLQEQTAALEQANQLLHRRNEELDAFAHTVAHDLKNPLSIVIGYAEILRDEVTEAEHPNWHDYLMQVIQAGRKGDSIIRELLLLAAVRREDVELVPLDMAGIVAQALERLSHHMAAENVVIVQPTEWPVVIGYAGWVEEVWVNYISNAIKYGGRPCHIELGAKVMPGGWVRFTVQDNGEGLTPEAQARLFTEFTRLEVTRAEGHGLGLSVVRRIVEKLNGRVGIISAVGQGSTFYFELPSDSEQQTDG